VGTLMQQKGQKYGDLEMVQKGKELEDQAQGIETQGTDMIERGNGITQMMGQ